MTMELHSPKAKSSKVPMSFKTYQDFCLRQELLEYMDVHDNDASESLQPSWGKNMYFGVISFNFQWEVVYTRYRRVSTSPCMSKDVKTKPLRKIVAFSEGSDNSKLMEKMEALTTKIDSQFKDIKGEIGKTYDPPINTNDKTTIIHDDSDDEANKADKEDNPSSSKPKKSD
ncbi:hypothetical protein Tco_0773478 [Tanacetum coccineum]|uniref:Uncharacterized protein n=1 Tax=Tanacetum coccineum TaxID=301880 RepID=A0ABQ4ZLV9_9ASTR